MGNTDRTTGGTTSGQGATDKPGNPAGQADWIIDSEGAARAAGPPEVAGHGEAHGTPLAQPETVAGGEDKDGAGAIDSPDEVRGNTMPLTQQQPDQPQV